MSRLEILLNKLQLSICSITAIGVLTKLAKLTQHEVAENVNSEIEGQSGNLALFIGKRSGSGLVPRNARVNQRCISVDAAGQVFDVGKALAG